MDQWIAHGTEAEAASRANDRSAPGPTRKIESVSFGKLLDDNPRNLVHLYGQYYWAEDLV